MQGYWQKPKESAEAIDSEGWFHSGDIATIDHEGFVFIIDRKKELIVLSNGKKISPQFIESRLCASTYISQALVIGDKHNFLTALIYPNHEALKALKRFVDLNSFLEQECEFAMKDLARFEQVKRFFILPEEFSIENGLLTPSLKPKRKVILERYQTAIESLYKEHS